MSDDLKLRLKSILRRAGLAGMPKPALLCLSCVLVVLLGVALWRFWPVGTGDADEDFQVVQAEEAAEAKADVGVAVIAVDVEGCVLEPGLYELPRGSRAGDAIEAAGGMTKKAAQGSVNLALQLEDGQQVVVPSKAEAVPSSMGGAQASPSAGGPDDSSNANGFVNINTATAEQLQQLSGIGEALSQRIIDYRESNGAFASVDDLTKVSGIGDARLESIRDGICV